MRRIPFTIAMLLFAPGIANADEVFVTIQRVSGRTITIVEAPPLGRRGGGAAAGDMTPGMRGRGRRGQSVQATTVTVPANARITTAQREQRTGEFRVGVDLSGELRNPIFRDLSSGLQARIVTDGNRITEINVVTSQSDINQSNTDASSGRTVIAVRPKRPPMRRP